MDKEKLNEIIRYAEEIRTEIENGDVGAAAYEALYDELFGVQLASAHCIYIADKPESFFDKEVPEEEFQKDIYEIIDQVITMKKRR